MPSCTRKSPHSSRRRRTLELIAVRASEPICFRAPPNWGAAKKSEGTGCGPVPSGIPPACLCRSARNASDESDAVPSASRSVPVWSSGGIHGHRRVPVRQCCSSNFGFGPDGTSVPPVPGAVRSAGRRAWCVRRPLEIGLRSPTHPPSPQAIVSSASGVRSSIAPPSKAKSKPNSHVRALFGAFLGDVVRASWRRVCALLARPFVPEDPTRAASGPPPRHRAGAGRARRPFAGGVSKPKRDQVPSPLGLTCVEGKEGLR